MLSTEQAGVEHLENSQPTHIAKNEEAYSAGAAKGVAVNNHSIKTSWV